ncbi:hypothetical protein MMC16_002275 [Acarospora aff. strigata]|nr:hypothetical protein [Acarospora aff. strigata]
MPPRTKKQNANQHNPRHENGLVGPGRRVAKQRSNGQLNGNPNGPSLVNTASQPTPAAAPLMTHASENVSNGTLAETKSGVSGVAQGAGRERRYSEASSEGQEAYADGVPCPHAHRSIDVNAVKDSAVHGSNLMNLTSTILRSCPLGDTIAILIILLQLPPTFVTIVNCLFALLTFVPPTATTISSIPYLNDIFQGAGGTPTLATIALVDAVFLVFWLFLWAPAQNFALDLAQAVVAITLGGGYSSKGSASDSATICIAIISASHLLQRKTFCQWFVRSVWPTTTISDSLSSRMMNLFPTMKDHNRPSRAGWLRSLLAVHILTQGLVRMVRRWISRRESVPPAASVKKSDPEAAAGWTSNQEIPNLTQSSWNNGTTPTTEGLPLSSLANGKGGKEKISSGKKRRKQGTFVRSQQPLWAAFASTKVTIVREYEQSQATAEATGSRATGVNNLGSAPFDLEEGSVWITHVGPTSIHFKTSYFETQMDESTSSPKPLDGSSSLKRKRPFYIRVNDADWTSIKIEKSSEDDFTDETSRGQWSGEIFGLSPCCTYKCVFLRSEDGEELYNTKVTTHPAPSAERGSFLCEVCEGNRLISILAASLAPSPIHQSLRPSSPITTLKNSIAAAEAQLSETRNRQKRTRRDHKSSSATRKKEVDSYVARLASAGGGDERHRQRVLQINQHIRQAEDAIAAVASQIDTMGGVPESDTNAWRQKKEAWEQEKERQSRARSDVTESRESANREISAVQSEASATQQKRERLQARHSKLNEQHERIISANAQGLDEQERKMAEHAARESERQKTERQYHDQYTALDRAIRETQFRSQQAWQQVHAAETAFQAYQHPQPLLGSPVTQSPTTPEGNLPGTTTIPHFTAASAAPVPSSVAARQGYGFAFPSFHPHSLPDPSIIAPHSHSHSRPESILRHEGRGRSSSMLSGASGTTDFYETEPGPSSHMPSTDIAEQDNEDESMMMRKRDDERNGSGSVSGSSGSQRDPMSPLARHVATSSPLGGRASLVWN